MKEVVKSDQAPAALGPYSQAIKVRGSTIVYCSGQIGLDPQTGNLVGETATEQARRVLENLKAVVEAAGAHLSDVVKTTLYLTDINELPKGAKVEIDATAVLP